LPSAVEQKIKQAQKEREWISERSPSAIYQEINQAQKTGDLDKLKGFLTQERRKELEQQLAQATDPGRAKKMLANLLKIMAPVSYKTDHQKNIGEEKVFLYLTGYIKDISTGSITPAWGKVTFFKEEGQWKEDKEAWRNKPWGEWEEVRRVEEREKEEVTEKALEIAKEEVETTKEEKEEEVVRAEAEETEMLEKKEEGKIEEEVVVPPEEEFTVPEVAAKISEEEKETEEEKAPVTPSPAKKKEVEVSKEGKIIDLKLDDVELEKALRLITEKSGLKFIIPPAVKDRKVSVYLPKVKVKDALKAILTVHSLGSQRMEDSDIYIISEIPPAPTLATAVIRLNFAKASDLEALIRANLTENGSLSIDSRTNTMVIKDIPPNVEELQNLLSEDKLDRAPKQVFIRAEIAEISTTAELELGIDWDIDVSIQGASKQIPFPLRPEEMGRVITRARQQTQDLTAAAPHRILPTANSLDITTTTTRTITAPTFTYGLYSFRSFTAALRAWEGEGLAELLAEPRILTLDNEEATIEINRHVAVTTETHYDDAGNVTMQEPVYEDVGVSLKVTPQINPGNYIVMSIEPTVSSVEAAVTMVGAINTKTRTAKTKLMVQDEQTIIIGGLMRTDDSQVTNRVPFLGHIPFIGEFFKYRDNRLEKSDLVIFLSPQIIDLQESWSRMKALSEEHRNEYQKTRQEIVGEIQLQKKLKGVREETSSEKEVKEKEGKLNQGYITGESKEPSAWQRVPD